MNTSSKKISSKSSGKKKEKSQKQKSKVSVPLASSRPMRTTVPVVSGSAYSGDGRVRIKHREYVQDVNGSVAFSAALLSINPGLSSMFPWLSVVASQFESYLFRKLSFEYETQKSASTSGSLMLAVDYDASDSAPVNKSQLMAYHNAVRSAVWEECCYRGDSADLKKFGVQRYIRSGSLAANLDLKTYDVGNLVIATQGEADTTAIGELYVEYDVELITPQVNVDLASANSLLVTSSTSTRASPFTGATLTGGISASVAVATLTINKPGKYILVLENVGTVMTNTAPTLTGTATVSAGGALGGSQMIDAAATHSNDCWLVSTSDPGQTIIFDFTASCTTLSSIFLRLAPYGSG